MKHILYHALIATIFFANNTFSNQSENKQIQRKMFPILSGNQNNKGTPERIMDNIKDIVENNDLLLENGQTLTEDQIKKILPSHDIENKKVKDEAKNHLAIAIQTINNALNNYKNQENALNFSRIQNKINDIEKNINNYQYSEEELSAAKNKLTNLLARIQKFDQKFKIIKQNIGEQHNKLVSIQEKFIQQRKDQLRWENMHNVIQYYEMLSVSIYNNCKNRIKTLKNIQTRIAKLIDQIGDHSNPVPQQNNTTQYPQLDSSRQSDKKILQNQIMSDMDDKTQYAELQEEQQKEQQATQYLKQNNSHSNSSQRTTNEKPILQQILDINNINFEEIDLNLMQINNNIAQAQNWRQLIPLAKSVVRIATILSQLDNTEGYVKNLQQKCASVSNNIINKAYKFKNIQEACQNFIDSAYLIANSDTNFNNTTLNNNTQEALQSLEKYINAYSNQYKDEMQLLNKILDLYYVICRFDKSHIASYKNTLLNKHGVLEECFKFAENITRMPNEIHKRFTANAIEAMLETR